jgi:hypothetical protein
VKTEGVLEIMSPKFYLKERNINIEIKMHVKLGSAVLSPSEQPCSLENIAGKTHHYIRLCFYIQQSH